MNYCVFNNKVRVGIEVPIECLKYKATPIAKYVREHMTFIPEELLGKDWDYTDVETVKNWNYTIIPLP